MAYAAQATTHNQTYPERPPGADLPTRGERAVQILAYPLNYYLSSADECPLARNQNPRRPRNTEAQKMCSQLNWPATGPRSTSGGEIAFQDAQERYDTAECATEPR